MKYRTVLTFVFITGFAGLLTLKLMPTNAAPPGADEEKTPSGQQVLESHKASGEASFTRVSAIIPQTGGTIRSTRLPCSAHWYDSADLFAKVSGYLETQNVDIGSRVKAGDVLARIDVPELEEDVVLAEAALNFQLAAVGQFEARKKSAIADFHAAEAACVKAEADVQRWNAEILFREKEYHRLEALSKANSVQEALVDEKLFQLQSVQAGKHSAETAVLTAKQQAAAASARVDLAEADLTVTQMKTKIEEARLKKAQLYASFSKIISPYDGVVVARRYHVGEFIRSADKSPEEALLTVGRTDLIRVVVHIPDRDVPYANPGDAVEIEFDTLPGEKFSGKLARIAYSEDIRTRTMRAEVDLPNTKNHIVDQMYGRMTIELHSNSKTLTLPAVCLVGDLKEGTGNVFVVNGETVHLQSVAVGLHDGIRVEILSGLSPQDVVVMRPPPGLSSGARVSVDLQTEAP